MVSRSKSPLCAFASWFPARVGADLEEARALAYQSRETSWTDHMLLELKKLRNPHILVQNSNERVTGADMDWHFVSRNGRRHLHLAVQAKILHYTTVRAPYRYGELAYPDKTGRQSRQLTNFAKRQLAAGFATYPLYLFYNPSSVVPRSSACSPGVTLANAYRVRNHLDVARKKAGNGKVPLQDHEFWSVSPLMFCLHRIFCCSGDVIPSPDEVAQSLSLIDGRIGRSTNRRLRPPKPSAGGRVPADVELLLQAMMSGPVTSEQLENPDFRKPDRPRVIFLGGVD